MKIRATLISISLLASTPAFGITELISDNFDAPDNANFDASAQAGRRTGVLGPDVQLRSSLVQHSISGNKLKLLKATNEGRVRFHDVANSFANWHNFAAGTAGAAILNEGGIRIEFDWTPVNNTDQNWVEISTGISAQAAGEPNQRVTDINTDFGILFRHNGGTQYFDNGTATTGGSFTATATVRHVVLDLAFTSFADNAAVKASASVDGTAVITDVPFTWAGNSGALYIEFGANIANTFIDNFSMKTLKSEPDTDGDGLGDAWEMAKAGNLTDLNGLLTGPGPGAGTGNFDGDSLTDLQEYNLRGLYPDLDPTKADTDGDGLEDGAELNPVAPRVATNPTLADTDGDGLNDFVESNTGTFAGAGNTGSSPTSFDTDGDQYPDFYEVQWGGNPTLATSFPTALPPGIELGIVTDEASTGISSSETYTHKISGGGAANVNGVELDVLNATSTPANFAWDGKAGGKSVVAPINNGTWNPAAGNVTGAGNLALFGGFTYSGNGAAAGNSQTFTLSGLETGKSYEMRVYIRKWDNGTVRPAALKFTNGAQATDFFILEDRPGTVLGNANDDSAYYISYTYVAAGTNLVMEATVPKVSSANGSFHMFGLTNREASPPLPLDFTGIEHAADGSKVTLTFNSRPGKSYVIEFSTGLTAAGQTGGWTELSDSVPSQGNQTVYIDTVASNLPRAFYRVREAN